jgi:predicted nucleic acid-binding protein
MTLVVDASVALKWYVVEQNTPMAWAVREGGDVLIAPDLVVPEVCNGAWKAWRRGELEPEQRQRIARHIAQAYDRLMPSSPLAERALAIAGTLDHPVYDCFYLALAEMEGGQLVTADRQLRNKTAGTQLAGLIRLLGET